MGVGRAHSAAGTVERLRQRHPPGVAQVRRVFALFAVLMVAVSAPPLVLVPGLDWPLRLAHLGALAWLATRWVTEYRRGLAPAGWDVLDLAVLLVLAGTGDAMPAVGLFYGASYWRAVTAATPRAVAMILGSGSVLLGVILLFEPVAPQRAVGPVIGLVGSSLLIHLVVATMSRHEQTLRQEREFLHAVVENVDAGVLACDAEGVVTLINEAARRLHGIPVETTAEEHVSARYGLLRPDGSGLLAPQDVPMIRALRGEHVRNQEVVMASDSDRHADRTVLANARPIVDDSGQRLGAVLALHDVTGIKRAEAALRRQALHDPLTDLPNRVLLLDRLEHALARRERSGRPVVLLFIDLDGFKTVNDSLGHATGDAVLVAVAERLLGAVRSGDTVARLSGDEFALLLEDTPDAEVATLTRRLLDRLSAPMDLGGRHLVVTASVGVATSTAAADAGDLLRNADLAMYAAKAAGRSRSATFRPEMHDAAVHRLTMEAALRRALAAEELRLVYQPICDARSGRLLGVEALLRWTDPQLGAVAPAEFIPLAESSGLIVPLGQWVLAQACRQGQRWRAAHPGHSLWVAVNVSVRQLREPDLLDTVARTLSETGLDPTALVLEITEGDLMNDFDASPVLEQLRGLGAAIAIDDFGTGHSSLGRLRELPIDHVKIDRSFVEEIDGTGAGTAPIAAATIALAHSLGLSVVAEGVEHDRQVAFLRHHGCDAIQGYRSGRPGEPAVIDQLLATGEPLLPVPRLAPA
jgi:diguanylate cyclase (GGDEF)-like protein/PAS domain S-box-containing protein